MGPLSKRSNKVTMNEELFEEWEKSSIILNRLEDTFDREMEEDNEIATDFMRCQCVIGVAVSAVIGVGVIIYNLI